MQASVCYGSNSLDKTLQYTQGSAGSGEKTRFPRPNIFVCHLAPFGDKSRIPWFSMDICMYRCITAADETIALLHLIRLHYRRCRWIGHV